jgi:hypothetical protein
MNCMIEPRPNVPDGADTRLANPVAVLPARCTHAAAQPSKAEKSSLSRRANRLPRRRVMVLGFVADGSANSSDNYAGGAQGAD